MSLPQQKVSTDYRYRSNEKGLNNIEETAQYYINSIFTNNEEQEIVRLYRMLEVDINEEDYNYVLNPFNTKVAQYTRFRGRLRNFNIISPVIEMLLSEFGRRNHTPRVIQSHPNDENDKDRQLNEMLNGYRAQNAVNALNEIGVQTGQESKNLPPQKEAVEEFNRTYKATRTISGQKALDYIIYDKDLADKYIDLYRNYLVCGRPISYKGVNMDDVYFEVVPPFDYYFPYSSRYARLEDRDWGIRKWDMSPNQILDYHRGYLSKEIMEELKRIDTDFSINNSLRKYSGHMYMSDDDFNNVYRSYYRGEENAVEHYHIVFKSFKRIAILTYKNEVGEIKEMEVEDTYKIDPEMGDISLKYDYKNALYETYKLIFNGREEFIRTGEIPYDRAAVNNSSQIKLPYNGIALTTIDGDIKSVVKTGINYQVLYNVLKYGFEKMINKNKDKIAIIPLGLINKGKNGWDEEKSMYYAEANSTLFIDETSPTASLALQGIKVLDMSLGKYIKEIIETAQQVKQEWWDAVGFNRQRYGETMASDGKAVTEQAIFRSSLISENLVRVFEKYQEKDYAGLLDLSKYAWIDGVKGQYITTDNQQALFELNADDYIYYLESDMDVHVVFSGDENKKIEDLKAYLFNATQNGMSVVPVLDAMDTTSFTLMKEIITKEERARQQLEQANKDADRQVQTDVAQLEAQTEKQKSDDKRYDADKRYKTVIDATIIKEKGAESSEADEILEALSKEHEMTIDEREQNRKEEDTASKILKDKAEISKIKKETSVMTKEKPSTNKTNN